MKKLIIILFTAILMFACVPKGYYLPQQDEFYKIKRMKTVENVFDCSDKAEMYKDILVESGIKAEVVVVYITVYNELLHKIEKDVPHALVKYQNPETGKWHLADPTLPFHNGVPADKTNLLSDKVVNGKSNQRQSF